MEIIKDNPQPENQINYIPGHIVLTPNEATNYITNGGVCAIYKDHLEIYINPLITSTLKHNDTTDENTLIQQIQKNAVIKITDDNIEELPPPIEESNLIQAFEGSKTTEKSYCFHIFNFNKTKLIIVQTDNLLTNITEYTGPFRIISQNQSSKIRQILSHFFTRR